MMVMSAYMWLWPCALVSLLGENGMTQQTDHLRSEGNVIRKEDQKVRDLVLEILWDYEKYCLSLGECPDGRAAGCRACRELFSSWATVYDDLHEESEGQMDSGVFYDFQQLTYPEGIRASFEEEWMADLLLPGREGMRISPPSDDLSEWYTVDLTVTKLLWTRIDPSGRVEPLKQPRSVPLRFELRVNPKIEIGRISNIYINRKESGKS